MLLATIIFVALTANICSADNDARRLARVPVMTATTAPTAALPIKIDPTTQPAADSDYWDNDDFVPFQSNRHDEFDWKLTKALMLSDPSNMILSPFSVKLLLSLLSEAAGPNFRCFFKLLLLLKCSTGFYFI